MRLVLTLDALLSLRAAAALPGVDLAPAIALAELAGVDAVRLGLSEDLHPVSERDVYDARRVARGFELRMPASQGLLKVALEARPERVVLVAPVSETGTTGAPVSFGVRGTAIGPVVRGLAEAGIPVSAVVAPDLAAVKAAHAEGAAGVEIYTGSLVDLPPRERAAELTGLADAVRLASKLHLAIGLGGGLGYRTLREITAAAPAVQSVAVGRAAVARALLVGLDLALRDLRDLLARDSAAVVASAERVVGLGIELVELARFEAALARFGDRLRARCFTPGERAYAAGRAREAPSLAVRFAAKVAARRALGAAPIAWTDIEVVRAEEGAPGLRFRGAARAAARARGADAAWLSLSHERGLAVGHVVLAGRA